MAAESHSRPSSIRRATHDARSTTASDPPRRSRADEQSLERSIIRRWIIVQRALASWGHSKKRSNEAGVDMLASGVGYVLSPCRGLAVRSTSRITLPF